MPVHSAGEDTLISAPFPIAVKSIANASREAQFDRFTPLSFSVSVSSVCSVLMNLVLADIKAVGEAVVQMHNKSIMKMKTDSMLKVP